MKWKWAVFGGFSGLLQWQGYGARGGAINQTAFQGKEKRFEEV